MFLQCSLTITMGLLVSTFAVKTFSLNEGDKYVHFSGAAYCAHPRFKKEQVESWSVKSRIAM